MFNLLRLQHRSVPVLEGYGVGVNAVLCRNNEVCGNIGERLIPTGEGIARAGRVCGSCCRAAVLYLLSLKHRSVPVLEGYGVGVCAVNNINTHVCCAHSSTYYLPAGRMSLYIRACYRVSVTIIHTGGI